MKIIECKCPSCGSSLDVYTDTEYLRCNYCGSSLYIDHVVTFIDEERERKRLIDMELTAAFNDLLEKYVKISSESESEIYLKLGTFTQCIAVSFPANMKGKSSEDRSFFAFSGTTSLGIDIEKVKLDSDEIPIKVENACCFPETEELKKQAEEKMKAIYRNLPSEMKEKIKELAYYSNKVVEYAKAFEEYAKLTGLKEKYDTRMYVMGIEDIPRKEINARFEELVRTMRGITTQIQQDEEKVGKNKVKSLYNKNLCN